MNSFYVLTLPDKERVALSNIFVLTEPALLNMEDASNGGNIISMDSLAVTLYGSGGTQRNICNQALYYIIYM